VRRSLTTELEERLKKVVVHLEEPDWEPLLADLEVLILDRRIARYKTRQPVQRRKRIADAMNHFLSVDRPRVESMAGAIETYRDSVHAAGLQVDSPVLRSGGLLMIFTLLWQVVRLALLFLPTLLGTLFHLVPFVIVRGLASKLRQPGRKTISLWRLGLGLPVYGLWYAGSGWWFSQYVATWFVVICLLSLFFLGLISLHFWRGMGSAARLLWQQIRFGVRGGRLNQLRKQQDQLRIGLSELAAAYEEIAPPAPDAGERYRFFVGRGVRRLHKSLKRIGPRRLLRFSTIGIVLLVILGVTAVSLSDPRPQVQHRDTGKPVHRAHPRGG